MSKIKELKGITDDILHHRPNIFECSDDPLQDYNDLTCLIKNIQDINVSDIEYPNSVFCLEEKFSKTIHGVRRRYVQKLLVVADCKDTAKKQTKIRFGLKDSDPELIIGIAGETIWNSQYPSKKQDPQFKVLLNDIILI